MIDFELTEDHRMVQSLAREVAAKKVKPTIAELDRASKFDPSLMTALKKADLLGICIPEKYGGMGQDYISLGIVCEEMEYADTSARVIFSVHVGLNSMTLLGWANEEQKQKYLVPQAKGEKISTFGLTEPGAGSDAVGIATTADKDGDNYILNGEKHLITNADFTDLFMVACHTGPKELGHKCMSALIVERDTPGFVVEEMAHLMGCKGIGHGILKFENCKVPVKNVVGEEGMGLKVFLGELEPSRVFVAASSLGTAERALEESIKYAKDRVTFGKPIASRESIRTLLADMAMDIYGLRLMLEDVAQKIDTGKPCPLEASIAKTHGLETVCRVTDKAMQVLGGRSYLQSYPIERLFREARINVLEEGTPTIQRLVTARAILSGQLPWSEPW